MAQMISVNGCVQKAAFAAAMAAGLALGAGAAWAAGLQEPAAAEVVIAPDQASLRAAMPEAGSEIAAFYERRAYQPLWLGDNGAARRDALLAALRSAADHALPVSRYNPDGLARRMRAASTAADRAQAEIALTEAYLAYAGDLSSGLLTPREVDRELYVYPVKRPLGDLLNGMSWAGDPAKWLASLAPKSADYAKLVARYATYRDMGGAGAWGESLPKHRTLKAGDRSEVVPLLRARLTAMGFHAADTLTASDTVVVATAETANDSGAPLVPDPMVFDPALEEAVRLFQARHGLNEDGVVGPATRGAVNTSATERARQIAVNLERMRWLNRDLGEKHVYVNIASFDMMVIERGEPVFESRVVVGKSRRHRTPEFSDEMEYMVVNPSWNVPYSIASKEILPKLQENPAYLEENNMTLRGVDDPSAIDWSEVTRSTFPGRIRQSPGAGNALGEVKFMFPNDHSIYLHDTPSKSLFARDRRAFSHGCIRVQRPQEFAHFLLSAQRDDAKAYYDRQIAHGRESWLHLDEHVPVHLTYRTAWVERAGEDQFRADIYGRDAKVLAALSGAGVDLPQ
ncbi:MAG: L,D-transpeptidase family protein [Pseudomonadota bacterium]